MTKYYSPTTGEVAVIITVDHTNECVCFEVNGKTDIWAWSDFIKKFSTLVSEEGWSND